MIIRTVEQVKLLFERLGFELQNEWKTADSAGRDILLATLFFRCSGASARAIDRVESTVNAEAKVATCKLALMRALCDIARARPKSLPNDWHSSTQHFQGVLVGSANPGTSVEETAKPWGGSRRQMKVKEAVELIQRDGWRLARRKGSHRQFTHATKSGRVTIAGGLNEDLAKGTVGSILRQAGLRSGKL